LLEEELGENEFVANADDVADMLAALTRVARKAVTSNPGVGRTSFAAGYREWLKFDLKRRHPILHRRWSDGRHVLPLTQSQYYRYVKKYAALPDELASAIPALHKPRSGNALLCRGPGEVYELDATGGQIVLITKGGKVYRPVIYIIIDRWSRFIVSVFVSLRPCSWEVLRTAL
jgi:transposase InsO family protein